VVVFTAMSRTTLLAALKWGWSELVGKQRNS
jgi:hypothetical protein